MNVIKVAIRVDASDKIGAGHVMRCLTLADQLRDQGADCEFICSEHPGHLIDYIRGRHYVVNTIPSFNRLAIGIKNIKSLERIQVWDAEVCKPFIFAFKPDWIVVDHYDLDYRWERIVSGYAKRIMVIDDLADREHDCDILLDQNLVENFELRYNGKINSNCQLLLGPKYAMLNAEYEVLHSRARKRCGPVRRILISFGGADPQNMTGLVLSALLSIEISGVQVDLVLPRNCENREIIKGMARRSRLIRIHDFQPSLSEFMERADLSIGAAGSTAWERCCLGLPCLVITLAENQIPTAKKLNDIGAINWLGHFNNVNEGAIKEALTAALDAPFMPEWFKSLAGVIDGKGVKRVVGLSMLQHGAELKFRPTKAADELLLLGWANDEGVRSNSFNSELITETTHNQWFWQRLSDRKNNRMYIAQIFGGLEIGLVRFERYFHSWEIHFSLAPEARGKKFGCALVRLGIKQFLKGRGYTIIMARVMVNNVASQKIFLQLGFQEFKDKDWLRYEYEFNS